MVKQLYLFVNTEFLWWHHELADEHVEITSLYIHLRWTQHQDDGKSRRHRVSPGNALTSLAGIRKKINGIRQDYRNNSYNFEAKLMRISDDIQNFLTEIVDVLQ